MLLTCWLISNISSDTPFSRLLFAKLRHDASVEATDSSPNINLWKKPDLLQTNICDSLLQYMRRLSLMLKWSRIGNIRPSICKKQWLSCCRYRLSPPDINAFLPFNFPACKMILGYFGSQWPREMDLFSLSVVQENSLLKVVWVFLLFLSNHFFSPSLYDVNSNVSGQNKKVT